MTYRLRFPETQEDESAFLTMETCCSNTKYVIKLTFPIIHHNMFLRKTKSTPIFKTSLTFVDENERLNRNIYRLQTMIDNMIKEYEYMDQPLKFPQKQESSSVAPTTDNSIFLNQQND